MDDDSENFKQLDDLLEDDEDGIEIMEEDHGEEHHFHHHDEDSGRMSHDDHNHNDHLVDGILDHQMMAAKNDMDGLHSTSDSGSDTDYPLLGHDSHHNHQHQYHPPMSTPGQHFGHGHHESVMTNTATAAAFCKGMPMVM